MVDLPEIGIVKFTIDEVKFNKKEANKLKNQKTAEDLEHSDLEKE